MSSSKRTNKVATNTTARTSGNWQGMNWIRQEKRLAIYLRDGLACAYCGCSAEQGTQLTLDHVVPHAKGGSNHEQNLVTCCFRCNSSRGDRSVRTFAKAVAAYVNDGRTPAEICAFVRKTTDRSLKPHKAEAAAMIARRGSAAKVLAAM